jgi:hypothetical protein
VRATDNARFLPVLMKTRHYYDILCAGGDVIIAKIATL